MQQNAALYVDVAGPDVLRFIRTVIKPTPGSTSAENEELGLSPQPACIAN